MGLVFDYLLFILLLVHACDCIMYVQTHVYGGQRSTLGVVPQEIDRLSPR